MRQTSLSGGGVLLLAAANLALVAAKPYPKDVFYDAGYSYLEARDCANPCGADSQFCCGSGEACTTLDNNVATCVGGNRGVAGGNYGYTTKTWTETRTYTSTIMTFWEPPPEPTGTENCKATVEGWQACGIICCAGWQTCAVEGQCTPRPGVGEGATVIITRDGQVTTQYSAPYRITGTTTVVTSGVQSTTTATTSSEPTESGDSDTIGAGGGESEGGGGLSAGAIAGIVIGSLVGVALLLLLCFCCIARGLWNAIFGRKKKTTKERVDVYEEGYSRHGSAAAHGRRDRHTGWFGGGGRPSSAGGRTEKKSSGKRWLGLAGLAATMLALLNLRKDKKPSHRAGSRYSNSYYSYSDTTGTRKSIRSS